MSKMASHLRVACTRHRFLVIDLSVGYENGNCICGWSCNLCRAVTNSRGTVGYLQDFKSVLARASPAGRPGPAAPAVSLGRD